METQARPEKAGKSNARAKRLGARYMTPRQYAAARQHAFRLRAMERKASALGLTVHTRCLCGCGLTIRPSIMRPYARGHKAPLKQGVLRVIPVRRSA